MRFSIWPIPQRVLDPNSADHRAGLAPYAMGGRYLLMPEGRDVTGMVARDAVVDVTAAPSDRFTVAEAPDPGDGDPPGRGPLVRTNLFPSRHGWRWLGGGMAAKVLVSVAVRGIHYFAMRVEFAAVLLHRRPDGSEPRMKPVCRGAVAFGPPVGEISVRGGGPRTVYGLLRVAPL